MTDKSLIKVLIAIIFGLITWSAQREMGRLDTQIEVLHRRVNEVIGNKVDKEDFNRELQHIRESFRKLRK